MRILLVANDELLKRGGAGIRSRMTADALGRLGDVQFVSIAAQEQPDWLPFGERRGVLVPPVGRSPSTAERLLWPVQGRNRGELGVDHDAEQKAIAAAVEGPVDLVWAISPRAALSTPPGFNAPMITDVIDWDGDLRVERGIDRARRERSLRSIGSAGLGYLERRSRRQSFAKAAIRSAFLVVCTEQGKRDMGLSPVEVLDNAYPTPPDTTPLERAARGEVVLFVGSFSYGPNLDGACWLLDEVLPALRVRVPEVQVRLVGRSADALPVEPGVAVSTAAHVPDLSADLAAASLSVVPLRRGSGSRIKILESFAHGIPVVSTTVGAEGLAVRDGEHLLIADNPVAFADASAHVLRDAALARRLVAAANALYAERYSTPAFEARVSWLVKQATA